MDIRESGRSRCALDSHRPDCNVARDGVCSMGGAVSEPSVGSSGGTAMDLTRFETNGFRNQKKCGGSRLEKIKNPPQHSKARTAAIPNMEKSVVFQLASDSHGTTLLPKPGPETATPREHKPSQASKPSGLCEANTQRGRLSVFKGSNGREPSWAHPQKPSWAPQTPNLECIHNIRPNKRYR